MKPTTKLTVPLVTQRPELPTGSAITAVTMMLQYAGAKVDKMNLADEMNRAANPNDGFVGDPAKPDGQGIDPKGLLPLVSQYIGAAVDLTGADLTELEATIATGKPVVVWMGNFDGFDSHALLVTGYDDDFIYFNEPWTARQDSLPKHKFEASWQRAAHKAMSY
ncbi:C39 family peptidase [Levilactobacillus bambusae]|uniref:Peptidase C39-like domain-containing protein n=1 Tax=Levilactobacillus bambusae TaxID=2024736 RepID=A0A2V1MZ37_9LACO|nr:C39 family peptidase [Levilactobacillus bambusae]PWG00227.1 hypothetical protein DCM90_04645 [Levilactobacillus bambusae]